MKFLLPLLLLLIFSVDSLLDTLPHRKHPRRRHHRKIKRRARKGLPYSFLKAQAKTSSVH